MRKKLITDPGDLAATIQANPSIGLHGLITKQDQRSSAAMAAFAEGRVKLAEYEDDFERAATWMVSHAPRRTPNARMSSNRIHDLLACPQGVIVAAAAFLGRRYRRLKRGDNTVVLCVV